MKHARGRKYTKEEDDLLVLCSNERYKELAKEFGVSVNAISHHARKLGVYKFKWSKNKTKAEPEPNHVWGNNEGKPCPPPAMDLMHREVYVPPPSICPREGALDFKLCPSVRGVAASYRDRSHP